MWSLSKNQSAVGFSVKLIDFGSRVFSIIFIIWVVLNGLSQRNECCSNVEVMKPMLSALTITVAYGWEHFS